MSRPPRAEPDDPALDDASEAAPEPSPDGPIVLAPDLAALPIAGITRRRVAAGIGVVLAIWVIVVFARQVGEAQAAVATADAIAVANAERRATVASLERELDLIARPRYVAQQARGYGMGTVREIPFRLAPDAPPLPADAPGSAALRVGADAQPVSPLERWLTVLFGPAG